ncbi:exonuclease [Halovenus sp. WSH3]|uniref:Exonuclease n=1 Tax=Halovenus carboxidivorans TaxID=2692199 RepID=A0A6B0T6K0_9EURY|nr:exonuclease [Halovenus carboxidivorans]
MRVENSFLGAEGIGETIERRLWRQGVTHWTEFDHDCEGVGPTRAERIESFIEGGQRALERGDVSYFERSFPTGARWRLYESFRDQACFFDIETTGLDKRSSVVTTVSLHRDGQTRTLVRGDDLTREDLLGAFEDAGLVVTFNGARFDIPFLEHAFDIDLDLPHIDLMPTCRKVGLSGGLSEIERELGIGRELPDVDGREAVRLWHEHERGVDGALDRLIEYNQEDTENMVPVLESVVDRLDSEVVPEEAPLAGSD